MKKILLIEDDAEMRENISEVIDLANYTVVSADNGNKGVELALSEKPDLIICDIMMPGLDGYGVLQSVSQNASTAGIPFIFLSAKAEKTDLRKGMNLGADDYLTKPVREADLLNAIRTRLRRAEFFRKNYSRDMNGLADFIDEAKKFSLPLSVAADYRIESFRGKEDLYKAGEKPASVYFVIKGKVKTWKVNQEGKEFITEIYGPGDFFGYVALLEGVPFSDSASAFDEAEVALIPKEDFLSLIYSNQEVSARFVKMLANNISEREERLLSLAYNSVRSRVADVLLQLYRKQPQNDNIRISREELASIAGSSTESVIRTLSDFKREWLIETDGREIKVLNPFGLERIRKFS